MKKTILFLASLALFLGSCGTSERKQQERLRNLRLAELTADLNDHSARLAQYETVLAQQKAKLNAAEQRKYQLESELGDYQRQIEAYLMNHKMAVASIVAGFGGSAVAMDTSNRFSGEMKDVAAVVGVIGALYALVNMEEIIEVGDVLMQADHNVTNLETAIERTENELRHATKAVRLSEVQLRTQRLKMSALRSEMATLTH